jgi:hypothetical protein
MPALEILRVIGGGIPIDAENISLLPKTEMAKLSS